MSEIASTAWPNSKLVRRLEFAALVLAIIVVCRLGMGEDLSWISWAVAAAAVLLLAVTRWPSGALLVLIGMSAMPRFSADVSGWKARPEHFAVVIVSLACCIWCLACNRKMRFESLDYWVVAYVAINYFSSAFGSSSPRDTLRWALLNNLAVLPYFLVRFLVPDAGTLRKAFRILLTLGIAESAYGILCYFSHQAFGTAVGMEIGQYFNDIAAPYGSLAEPNVFGAYAGCTAVLALAVYLIEGRRTGYLICFFVASLAAVLSLSRAALLALTVASAWVYWEARHVRKEHRRRTATLALALGLILLIVVPAVGSVIQQRFGTLLNQGLTDETTAVRLVQANEAIQEFSGHRLIGTGTASLQLSFDWSRYVPDWGIYQAWVGNVIVRILHDTGALGFAIFLGFLVSLGRKIRLGLQGRSGRACVLVALTGGALLYAISFQATDATLEAFTWVHLGLLSSAAILMWRSGENAHGLGRAVPGSI